MIARFIDLYKWLSYRHIHVDFETESSELALSDLIEKKSLDTMQKTECCYRVSIRRYQAQGFVSRDQDLA